MAEMIKVRRPDDGEILTVARKHFESMLEARGFTEVKDGVHGNGKTKDRKDSQDDAVVS